MGCVPRGPIFIETGYAAHCEARAYQVRPHLVPSPLLPFSRP